LGAVFLAANAAFSALVGAVSVPRVMLAAKRSNEQAGAHA
jgi:hypothetical protein